MALNLKRSNACASAEADAVCPLLNNGYLRIYDGTQAATADTALGAQVLLAELRFNATAAPAATNGVSTFNALTKDSAANATGTATWFRALSSNGTTVVMDGSVGTATCDLILNSVAIQINAEVDVTAFSYTANKG